MKAINKLFEEAFTLDAVDLNMDLFWDVEDIIGKEFIKVFGNGFVDDLALTAYVSNTNEDPRIHGKFRFCVYGKFKYADLEKKLRNMKSSILTVDNLYHPAQTYGISFNGIYEDGNTTYIGGTYQLREAKA